MENGGLVTITRKVYAELVEESAILRALEAFGVDNWEGFDFIFGHPDIGDYDTVEEYRNAWETFIDSQG